MKTLAAKKKKGAYKNTDAWLEAIYRNNKATIESALQGTKIGAKKTFKNIFKELVKEGVTPVKAINTIARSTLFTSREERLKQNFYTGLKADEHGAYKRFRELTKNVQGKYTKFDPNKLRYDSHSKGYIYEAENGRQVGIFYPADSKTGIIVRYV